MTQTPLVSAIRTRLAQAGYRDLRTPLRVAGVEFAFTAAMQGSDGRGLDLVVLVDTTTGSHGDRDATRIRQRLEALSRALDVTRSRLVLTAILAGASPSGSAETLSEVCRVLFVEQPEQAGDPSDAIAAAQLEDRIRILLPLSIPDPNVETEEVSAVEQLRRALPKASDARLPDAVIGAAREGAAAVTTAMAAVLDAELGGTNDEKPSPGEAG